MKYWVFQSNQVKGPHEPDDLAQLPGYSAETLVCPEGRRGTNMGDWQRAGMVPELSLSLIKASQLATSLKGPSSAPVYGALPPEPTLKDLAALGSLQEKVSLLDGSMSQLQDNLRFKESELLSLHRELDERTRQSQELSVKLGGLEERLSAVAQLRENLDKALSAEQDMDATIKRQSQTMDDLSRQIEDLKAELKARPPAAAQPSPFAPIPSPTPPPVKISRFPPKEAMPASDVLPAPGPSAVIPALEPKPVPLSALEPPKLLEPRLEAPAPAAGLTPPPSAGLTPPPLITPPAAGLAAPPIAAPSQTLEAPPPVPLMPAAELPPSLVTPPPSALPPVGAVKPPASAAAASRKAPPPVVSEPAAKAKGGMGKFVLAALVLALMGAGAALKLGLLQGKKEPPPVVEQVPLPPPPPPAPKTPTPEEQAEELKQAAITLVKSWPVGAATVGQILETANPPTGALSPWMADKIKDDILQVNFYAKTADGRAQTYEFEASLADKKVAAHNEAAQSLLAGKPAQAEPPKVVKKRKPRRSRAQAAAKAEEQPLMEDLLSGNGGSAAPEQAPAKPEARVPSQRRKARHVPARDVNKDLDALLSEGEAPAPASAPKARPKAPEEESLDQILLPGALKKPELAEPQAQPAAPETSAEPAEAAPKAGAKGGKAADAELLDDLLKP